jgi:hypothetical protein
VGAHAPVAVQISTETETPAMTAIHARPGNTPPQVVRRRPPVPLARLGNTVAAEPLAASTATPERVSQTAVRRAASTVPAVSIWAALDRPHRAALPARQEDILSQRNHLARVAQPENGNTALDNRAV